MTNKQTTNETADVESNIDDDQANEQIQAAETQADDVTATEGEDNSSADTEQDDAEVSEENQADQLSDQLEAAQAEIVKLKDAYLRAKAEEDNVRRRTEKELTTSRKFAIEGFAKEIVNVRDSLKLACSVELDDKAQEAVKSINEGVKITLKQLDTALEKFSVSRIEPKQGDKLDPNLHQAMSQIESEEVDSGCIIHAIQDGFQLHDRLLRPAMVVVAK